MTLFETEKINYTNVRILHIGAESQYRGGQKQSLFLHEGLLQHKLESYLLVNKTGLLYKETQRRETNHCYGFDTNVLNDLSAQVTTLQPDLIHYHDSKSIAYSRHFKNYLQLATRRVSYPIKLSSRLGKYRHINAHVGVSQEITTYLQQHFKNCHTIHSGMDLTELANPKKIPSFDPKCQHILFVGALDQQKGIEILFNAFNRISKDNVHLHIVGSGKLEKILHNITQKLSLSHKIHFYGQQTNVSDFYHSASVVVVPSVKGEGSSGVIKEAMAMSKVVIASNLKGNLELFEDEKTGIAFENKDEFDLSQKIEAVLQGNYSQLVPLEIKKAAANFTKEKMTRNYIKLYQELMENMGL